MRAAAVTFLALGATVDAFAPRPAPLRPKTELWGSKVGVYYGTEGQNTEAAADLLVELLNAKFDGIAGETSFPVDEIDGVEDLMDHELLLVGCPTWNTGADTERSGTDWDDLYYEDDGLPSLDFAGKKVAVFGCGDSVGYGGNFCDAIDELESVFASRNAQTGFGSGRRADVNFGVGRVDGAWDDAYITQVNEGDKTEARLSEWLDILAGEGFFGGDATAAPAPAAAAPAPASAPAAPAPAAAAVGAAPEPAVVDAVRGLLPDVGADPAKPYILTNENLVQLLMAQHSRLQRALRKIQELEGGVLVVPAAAPVEIPADDGEPPAKLDGGALATVRSVEVIVPDTPEGSAPIAHVELATSLPFVEGQCVSVLPPGNDEKGNPHKKRRLYTVASERGAQLALCVREVGVTSNFLHTIPKGSQLHLEGPMGKSMVLPADPKAGLVLIGTSTGAATFRGFLRRLYPANAAPSAGRGPIVVILGGATREAIPYVEEFEQAQERLGPGRFRLELALGGARVDDGSETTLPEKIKGLSLIAKEIMDRGGHTYVSGLRGMLKPCAAALDEFIDTKALKKEGRYHAEVY